MTPGMMPRSDMACIASWSGKRNACTATSPHNGTNRARRTQLHAWRPITLHPAIGHISPRADDGYTAAVNATPFLEEIGLALHIVQLEAVLIGNAAAALQGAPVTTVDFDFFFRRTPRNLAKLKLFGRQLGATVLRPYYPASDLFRVVRDEDALQVDFMGAIHGVRSFEGVRDRAARLVIGRTSILVASCPTSFAASAPRIGRATVQSSKCWRERLKKPSVRRKQLRAVERESRRNLLESIRRWQALRPEQRTNFLRKRLGPGRSAL
jgi:hypothetical protein